ncbi:cell surface protein [Rhizobium sp. 1399]|jgi:hypothetical protein|uniref:cell surface protein n=1 Tax=Rhizobium sp. 1399 TaxID=2817758 RepID=UPI002861954A|nr:cell surface protein [Rhizobium sp. 1399]MDR6668295.1 hypothetical protein [Rhizobium sp. 1399]
MNKTLIKRLPIAFGAVLCLAAANAALAAPVPMGTSPETPGTVEQVATREHSWNGYRGYENPREGYRRGPDGYWYPAKAFGVSSETTGSVGMPAPLAGPTPYRMDRKRPLDMDCNLRFNPGSGSSCNY